MIVSGGEKVFPAEVEDLRLAHPALATGKPRRKQSAPSAAAKSMEVTG